MKFGAALCVALASLVFAAAARGALNQPERVADVHAGPLGSNVQTPVPLGRYVLFRAGDGVNGEEIWRSDGTTAGTQLVADINPGAPGSLPGGITPIGDAVLFQAFEPTGGDELWRSDGSSGGTFRLADINPGPPSSTPRGLTAIGGRLVFRADDGAAGVEPWSSDATAAGTAMIADVSPGPASGASNFFFPVEFAGRALFRATEPVAGAELWRAPPAGPGAELVANINLAGGSAPLELTPVGDWLYFIADDGVTGRELWRSDGQPGGTTELVRDFDSAATDSGVTGLTAFKGRVYFRVDGDGNQTELWRSDGPGETEIVADINPVGDSTPQNLTPVGDTLYFTAVTSGAGRELWRSDGEPGAGHTTMVADIDPGGSGPCGTPELTPLGNAVYLCADDGATGSELWRSDGSAAGTVRVGDIAPGPASSGPSNMAVLGDALYFRATDGASGEELWAVDTAAPRTSIVSGPAPGEHVADATPALQLSSPAVDLDRYECATGGPFATCAGLDGAGQTAKLDDGERTLAVRAVDVRENADPTPAELTFTVDTTAPKLKFKGRSARVARGAVRVKLLCRRTELSGPCRGRLSLRAAERVGGGGRPVLAKGRLRLKPGKAKRVKLKLRPGARALLERAGSLKVSAKGPVRDSLGNRRTARKRLRLVG